MGALSAVQGQVSYYKLIGINLIKSYKKGRYILSVCFLIVCAPRDSGVTNDRLLRRGVTNVQRWLVLPPPASSSSSADRDRRAASARTAVAVQLGSRWCICRRSHPIRYERVVAVRHNSDPIRSVKHNGLHINDRLSDKAPALIQSSSR